MATVVRQFALTYFGNATSPIKFPCPLKTAFQISGRLVDISNDSFREMRQTFVCKF